jgi:hypothetical protein
LLVGQVYNEPINAALAERVSPTYRIGTLPTDDFEPNPTVANNFARAENLYIVGGNATADNFVERLLLVRSESDVSEPSPRAQALLAVSNGKIKRVDSINGIQSPVAAGTLPQPELDPDAPYVDSAILFGKVYFADGINYRVYDPRNDIVTSWDAQDAGSLPNRCKLLANWRGRAVLARGADDPHNWHMSEQGAPNNWDNFPPVSTATQAISGNNARAGLCPDLVNSLIPYNDDLLLFGCDSSLWMMRGDPMAGGVFDLVSDVTGVAFGRSWAKDPEGNLYFFGSRGGVYIMRPGGIPASMTQATIERRLTEVDLGQFYVEMFWNTYDDGLHLFLMPFTDTATHTKHFFWERRTGAWPCWEHGQAALRRDCRGRGRARRQVLAGWNLRFQPAEMGQERRQRRLPDHQQPRVDRPDCARRHGNGIAGDEFGGGTFQPRRGQLSSVCQPDTRPEGRAGCQWHFGAGTQPDSPCSRSRGVCLDRAWTSQRGHALGHGKPANGRLPGGKEAQCLILSALEFLVRPVGSTRKGSGATALRRMKLSRPR